MSVTKHLVCLNCKEYLWIGQGGVLYTGEGHLKNLKDFLLRKHSDGYGSGVHALMSVDEHELSDGLLEGCKEYTAE